MIPVLGRNVLQQLCTALGLAEHPVRSLQLSIELDDVVSARVEFFVTADQVSRIEKIVKDYMLVERGADPVPEPACCTKCGGRRVLPVYDALGHMQPDVVERCDACDGGAPPWTGPYVVFSDCQGSGFTERTAATCQRCRGRGRISASPTMSILYSTGGWPDFRHIVPPCPQCDGKGKVRVNAVPSPSPPAEAVPSTNASASSLADLVAAQRAQKEPHYD